MRVEIFSRQFRVMRHHNHQLILGDFFNSSIIWRLVSLSSAPVGSSASRMSGLLIKSAGDR